jgi:hypothetical protein
MKFYYLLTALALIGNVNLLAQDEVAVRKQHMMDSIKRIYMQEAAIRNPLLRRAMVTTEVISRTRVHSDLYGAPYFKAKLAQVRTFAFFNCKLTSWNKNMLTASVSFFNQHLDVNQIHAYQFDPGLTAESSISKTTVGLTLSFNRIDSLFGRMVMYAGSVSGLTNDINSIKKLSFLGGMMLSLKQTPATSLMAGLLLNLDPSNNVPIIPAIIYHHHFPNKWELSIDLPQRINMRRQLLTNAWFSFGSSLFGSVAFLKYNKPRFPDNVNYSSFDLKTGPGVEFRFAQIMMLGINAGFITPIMSRQFEQDGKANDYFINNRINSTPYMGFNLSVLPFH